MDKQLTKEEILDIENNKPDEMQTNWVMVTKASALSAMDIHAKQTSIAFAKWIPLNAYIAEDEYYYCLLSDGSIATEEELYNLFFQSQNNIQP